MFTPARSASDRNLLFGILALQMDFISRDALIRAMQTWVLDKSKPLGQLLVEQGAMAAEHRALLEPLVQKHVEMHDGDPQKSLAALNSVGSAKQELEQIADADVQASLATVSLARPANDDPWATLPSTAGTPTSSGLRFRVLRPHAKGGLGQVSVALDEELHREVAFKEIQDRHADHPESRARFLLEAEITGGLEHPAIVPVYGLGSYPDGRPFYAMRFIKGDSLQKAIARFHKDGSAESPSHDRTLALRQLLGRFIDVCDAIAYAHSRGVLHRDLKPGNIMLGPYGETLVVDWGLAKPLGSRGETNGNETTTERTLHPVLSDSAAPTQVGRALGTPAYMPPEQAAGRLDDLGPASDVYSLGATLYCLLTGTAPFEGGDVGESLRKVQAGEFPRPCGVRRDVPPALEAVCLKAMALKPEDRYASPRALSEDIEHWLADEPVSAWREPWQVRARRWVGRHRTLVTAAAATLLVAIASLTAATILLQAANKRERQAKDDKEAALRQAEANATEARHQEQLALEQKRQAEVNAQEAKHQKELAEDQKREAERQAAAAFDMGERFAKEVVQERTARLGADHLDTLSSKDSLVGLYWEHGNYDLAEPLAKEVVQGRTAKLGADHPDTLGSKNTLAALYWRRGKYDLAEPLFKEMLPTLTAKLGADHHHTLLIKNNLALVYDSQDKSDLAEGLYKEVVKALTARVGADDTFRLHTMWRLSSNLLWQKKYAEAEPILRECLAIQEKKTRYPWLTFNMRSMLGAALAGQKKYAEAEPLLLQGYEGMKQRENSISPVANGEGQLIEGLDRLVQLYDAWGKKDKASDYRKKLAEERLVRKVDSLYKEFILREEVLAVLKKDTTLEAGDRETALELAESHPENPEGLPLAAWNVVKTRYAGKDVYARGLRYAAAAVRLAPQDGNILNTLGAAQYRTGRYADALATLTKSEKLNATKEGSHPTDLAFLAMTQHQLGKKDEAKATLGQLRAAMKLPQWAKDTDCAAFLREAEELIEGKAANKKP